MNLKMYFAALWGTFIIYKNKGMPYAITGLHFSG